MPTADFQQCQIIILMSAAEPSQLIYPSENHGKLELEKSRRVGYRSGSLFFFFFFFFIYNNLFNNHYNYRVL